MVGKLYIVPTPVGNLKDVTFRAIEVLKNSDYIYCEDTRTSAVFLNFYEISAPRRSFHKFNENSKIDEIISLVKEGKNISVISDAGTPGISDPCGALVCAIEPDLITTLPGATAFVPAIVNSGLPTDIFKFVGFLPPKKSDRDKVLRKLETEEATLIFYESPHRIDEMLESLQEIFGDRNAAIVREISKIHEETIRFNLKDLPLNRELKGEIAVVVKGADRKKFDIYPYVDELLKENISKKDILNNIKAEFPNENIKRNDIYKYILEKQGGVK